MRGAEMRNSGTMTQQCTKIANLRRCDPRFRQQIGAKQMGQRPRVNLVILRWTSIPT